MSDLKRIIPLACAILLLATCGITVQASDTDYVLDNDGIRLATPKTYLVQDVITYLGEEGGNLYEPSDIFIDKEDNIFVADKGNNRIVKLNAEREFEKAYYAEGGLNAPQGVYYSDFGGLFIADTGNQRIINLNANDQVVEEFTKPDSAMLEESSDFAVNKLYISSQGLIYVIKGQQFMTINADNEFKGFIGANSLGYSLKRTLIRMFATEEQKSHMEMEEAPPFNNFIIADNGMIYAVAATDSAQIKKLNASGENIFPTNYVVERVTDENGRMVAPEYADIAVDSNEIISVLERKSGHIYQYDQDGNLITIFGGKGDKRGYFQNPTSIAVNSKGEVYVLDGSTGYIHIFAPTSFMENIKNAIYSYANGHYEVAYEEWKKVVETDVNYPLANMGLGQVLYKMDRAEEAMEYFEIAKTYQRYGKAFEDYRYAFIKANFFEVVIGCVVVVVAVVVLIFYLQRKSNKYLHDYYFGPDKEMKR